MFFGDKHDKSRFWAFTVGLILLLLITLVFSGALNLPNNSGGWLYAYQTLFTGVVGLTTALIIWYQYKDTVFRKRLSERAKMNDALSSICGYAKESFYAVKDNSTTVPEQPSEGIGVLKNAIEFLDNKTSEAVYELIIFYQVHNARLESYIKNPKERAMNGKDNALYDAVRLHALTLRLFDYARKEKEIIKNSKLSANEMNSALKASYGHTKTYMAHTDPDQSMGKLIKRIEKEHT